jgi:hypothetical protein
MVQQYLETLQHRQVQMAMQIDKTVSSPPTKQSCFVDAMYSRWKRELLEMIRLFNSANNEHVTLATSSGWPSERQGTLRAPHHT